ncbi:ribbon-helix-helix domain-containing protein [Enterococcus faecium]|nr:ribbon-helix-helix domain-containing protein [Enterococcus faecium]
MEQKRPQIKTTTITMRYNPEEKERLKSLSEITNKSQSDIVEEAVKLYERRLRNKKK